MGRYHSLQNNATAGELTPRLARSDLSKYNNGYHILKNAYPIPQGAVTRRPGTKYATTTNDSGSKQSRLIPFVASDNSVYCLEFANDLIRILDTTGAVLTTVVSTYLEAELFAINFVQSADVLYLFHGSHKPAALVHVSGASWTLGDLTLSDGPYQPQNTGTTTITPSATTGAGVTLTASAALFYNNMIGTCIRLFISSKWGFGTVTAVADTTHCTVTVDTDLPFGAATATTKWRLSEYDATRGWPTLGCFQENRLVMAANASNPITGFASQSNAYSSTLVLFGPTKSDGTVTADMSIQFTLAAEGINRILWMVPGPSLAVGTTAAEWLVESANTSEAWSQANSKQSVQTTRGSQANTKAIRIETSVLFVQNKGQKVREFTYDFAKNALRANDLMLLADHIALSPIQEMVYVQDPHSFIACRLANGELRFLTYIGDEDIGGWSRHIIGGNFNGGNAVVESIIVLPDYTVGYDALWMIVKRTIDGVTVRYIEVMQPPFFFGGDINDLNYATDLAAAQANAWFLDCALQSTGSSLTEVTNLDQLEGENIGVYADGASRPTQDCDLGTITLDAAANKILAGFKYSTTLVTIPLDEGSKSGATKLGTSLGKKQRITSVDLHLFETGENVMLGVGTTHVVPQHMDPIELRFFDSQTNTAPPLYSGWQPKTLGGTINTENVLYFQVDDPVPFTLLEYAPRGSVNEN